MFFLFEFTLLSKLSDTYYDLIVSELKIELKSNNGCIYNSYICARTYKEALLYFIKRISSQKAVNIEISNNLDIDSSNDGNGSYRASFEFNNKSFYLLFFIQKISEELNEDQSSIYNYNTFPDSLNMEKVIYQKI